MLLQPLTPVFGFAEGHSGRHAWQERLRRDMEHQSEAFLEKQRALEQSLKAVAADKGAPAKVDLAEIKAAAKAGALPNEGRTVAVI